MMKYKILRYFINLIIQKVFKISTKCEFFDRKNFINFLKIIQSKSLVFSINESFSIVNFFKIL